MDIDEKEFKLSQEFARFSGEVTAKLDRAVQDITKLTESTNSKIEDKADKEKTEDLEKRMRNMEKYGLIAYGVFLTLMFILNK